MQNVPEYISILFGVTTILTVYLFYRASDKSWWVHFILLAWLAVQGLIASTGYYTYTRVTPPRFILLVAPPLLTIIGLFVTPGGRRFLNKLSLKMLTLLHIVRVPVEIVLFALCWYKAVPELMTFEGRNFDILSGLSAPFIYYFGFVKKSLPRSVILGWNILCLGLLVNIVAHAVLSAPFPFQQLAFDQPNIAILYFPFVWLPCCVVPIVLLSHLAAIRKLVAPVKKETVEGVMG